MHLPLRLVKAAARRGQRRGSQALAAPVAGTFQWETTIFGTQLLVLKDKNNSSPNIILSGKSLKRCFSLGVKKEIEGRREEGKCIRKIIRAVRPGWGGRREDFACGNAGSTPGQRPLPLPVRGAGSARVPRTGLARHTWRAYCTCLPLSEPVQEIICPVWKCLKNSDLVFAYLKSMVLDFSPQ